MGLFDGLIGGVVDLLSGGGGGGASVNYGVTSTVQGGAKPVELVSTLQGATKPVELVSTIQGGAEKVSLDVGLDDVNIDTGLDDINVAVGGTGTTLATSSEFKFLDKIRSETDVDFALDVEPVQVDLCVNVGLTKLPQACIRQPYESHFGVTVLGAEILGFDWTGESNVIIDELQTRPHVVGGREVHHAQPRLPATRRRSVEPTGEGGFRIRVG